MTNIFILPDTERRVLYGLVVARVLKISGHGLKIMSRKILGMV
jgi:hypothetical protein